MTTSTTTLSQRCHNVAVPAGKSSLLPAKPGFASVDFDVVGKVTVNGPLQPLINQAKEQSNQDLYLINIHLKLINRDINNVGNLKRSHRAKSIEKSVKKR